MKVVINTCYGGFGLSKKATELLAEQGNEKAAAYLRDNDSNYWSFSDIKRDDPLLIEVVEFLGEEANAMCAKLSVEEYTFDIENFIKYYDGKESLEIPYGYR